MLSSHVRSENLRPHALALAAKEAAEKVVRWRLRGRGKTLVGAYRGGGGGDLMSGLREQVRMWGNLFGQEEVGKNTNWV